MSSVMHISALSVVWRALVISIYICLSCQPSRSTKEIASSERPNILLIMADDMGYSDIGCYGGEVRTPSLDRLAANGLRFSQFYNTGRCCPTRASLLTGLYPHQAGIGHMMNDLGREGYRGDLSAHSVTIAEVLRQAGYQTFMSGKWHLTKYIGQWYGDSSLTETHNWPKQRGFERFYGTIPGSGSYYNPVGLVEENTSVALDDTSYYYTDAISEKAVQYIREATQADSVSPFFGYIAYTAPHWPLHALPEDIARYEENYTIGWDSLRQARLQRMRKMGVVAEDWPLTARDERVPAWDDAVEKEWHARRMAVYAAQIDRMDQGIGRIIQELEETGTLENTIIFFLADNGGCAEEVSQNWTGYYRSDQTLSGDTVLFGNEHTDVMPGPANTYQSYGIPWANASNTPFRLYKHYVHEGGIATPLIVHWPAGIVAAGAWRHSPGHLIDIMATCVAASQATYPSQYRYNAIQPMEGVSLLPVFDRDTLEREAIYFEHEGNRAIRRGPWKLVAQGKEGPWELYHLARDRSETNNVANKNPALVQELATMWQAWAQRAKVLPWPS